MRSREIFLAPVLLCAVILMVTYPSTQTAGATLSTSSTSSALSTTSTTPKDASVAFQINAQHNGNIQGSSLKPPLKQLWTKYLGFDSYPLVVGEAVYLATNVVGVHNGDDAQVLAWNLRNGSKLWGSIVVGRGGERITYDNGRIFALDVYGLMQAFDARTGTLIWKTQLPPRADYYRAPPTAFNGIVYATGSTQAYAVRTADGKLLWQADVKEVLPWGLAVDSSGVYSAPGCGQVLSFAPLTGQQQWYFKGRCRGGFAATPAVYDGRVYARTDGFSQGEIVEASSGKLMGDFRTYPAAAFYNDLGFFLQGNVINAGEPTPERSSLVAINLKTGATVWSFNDIGLYTRPPIVINDVVYLASANGPLYAFDATSGKIIFQKTLPPAGGRTYESMSLAEGSGVLIVPSGSGLTAFSNEGPDARPLYFPETKHTLAGPFRQYWEANGGLAIFGYPISEPFREVNKRDGKEYLVQYFERNRFEYHPDLVGGPREVSIGLLGSEQTEARRSSREEPFRLVPSLKATGERFFTQFGHSLSSPMLDFWDANGSWPIFGYPISEPFQEKSPEDGRMYLVQYFERNRFEYHPENPDPYKIVLGRLGVTALQNAGR